MQAWYANNGLLLQLMIFIICLCEDVSDLFQIGDCSNSFINIVLCQIACRFLFLSSTEYNNAILVRQAAPQSIYNIIFDHQMTPHYQVQNWSLEVGFITFIYCFDFSECVHCPAYQTKAVYNDDEFCL